MNIQIALSGDMHVNVPKREAEAQRIAYWMLEDWKARGVHLIGIGGDLIDGPMTERQRAWLIEYISACGDVAPVVIVDGNHEPELSLRNAVGHLHRRYPVIVEDGARVHRITTEAGQVAVACVSFPHKSKLLAKVGAVSTEQVEDYTARALQDVFRGRGVEVRELGLPTVGLVHGAIKGSKLSVVDQPDRPLGLDIALPDLCLMGADFYCVPHIHLAQEWEWNGVTVATPSSPFYCDYGEAKHHKGYILLTLVPCRDSIPTMQGDLLTETDDPQYVERIWQRIPTPAVPMILVEGTYTGVNGDFQWKDGHAGWKEVEGADVRFRYHFEGDKRDAARDAAQKWSNAFTTAGAVNVTLDPVKIPTVRARIPELGTTVRLEDKLAFYWKSIGFTPDDERAATLRDMLRQLQEEAAAEGVSTGAGKGVPTLKKARVKNFFKFPGENVIDFSTLDGPLTTIIAPNECGKTLLMQLIGPGVNYGKTPTRGTLDDLAVGTDSVVEIVFDMDGAEWVLSQNCNGKDRKGHVNLLKNGETVLGKNAGREEYRRWAAKNLLPVSVYEAVICQSGTKSIIQLGDAERVDVLMKVLGLEIYEALAVKARQKATDIEDKLSDARARIAEIGDVDAEVSRLTVSVKTYQGLVDRADGVLDETISALDAAKVRAAAVEDTRAAYDRLLARRDTLDDSTRQIEGALAGLEAKYVIQTELLAEADSIHRAVDQKARLEQALLAARERVHERHNENSSALSALSRAAGLVEEKVRAIKQTEARVDGLKARRVELNESLDIHNNTLKHADSIRAAVNEHNLHQESLANKQQELAERRTKKAEVAGTVSEVQARLTGLTQQRVELERRVTKANELINTKPSVLKEVDRKGDLEKKLQATIAAGQRAHEKMSTLRAERDDRFHTRINSLRNGLAEIADVIVTEDLPKHARGVLDGDNEIVRLFSNSPAELRAATEEWTDALGKEKELRGLLETVQGAIANLTLIAHAEQAKLEAETQLADLAAKTTTLEMEQQTLLDQQEEVLAQVRQTEAEIRWIQEQIDGLAPLVARAPALDQALTHVDTLTAQIRTVDTDIEREQTLVHSMVAEHETLLDEQSDAKRQLNDVGERFIAAGGEVTKIEQSLEAVLPLAAKASAVAEAKVRSEELKTQIDSEQARLKTATAERQKLEQQIREIDVPPPIVLTSFEEAVQAATRQVHEHKTSLTVAERDLAAAQARQSRLKSLEETKKTYEVAKSNWIVLGQHLGKEGLQKEEVSFAGPALTSITNDLLRAVGDTRHTVSIETERLHSNKKQMIPTFDILIYDSEEQITKESRRLSDAGMELVGEPLRLALIRLGCERAGVKAPTIFRDEATGKMDVINAPRFVGYLRHFAEMLDARVLFVAQQPAVQELADSKLWIRNGQITTKETV